VAKKFKMIFSNTAKTISSIEDKTPSFAKRLGSGGDRRINNFEKGKKRELTPVH
jgi:hypothetical protein